MTMNVAADNEATIACDQCTEAVIHGESTSSLSLECSVGSICDETTLHCPNSMGGLSTVSCRKWRSDFDVIVYEMDGFAVNGTLELECNGNDFCNGISVVHGASYSDFCSIWKVDGLECRAISTTLDITD